jgi:predicted RNase H-like HicB family nuclease
MNKDYVALVEFDRKVGKYGVIVPDLPGFSSSGNTYEDAVKNATEGMASHIEVMKEFGEKVPSPRSIEDVRIGWNGWEDWNRDVKDYVFAMLPFSPPNNTPSIDTSLAVRRYIWETPLPHLH